MDFFALPWQILQLSVCDLQFMLQLLHFSFQRFCQLLTLAKPLALPLCFIAVRNRPEQLVFELM